MSGWTLVPVGPLPEGILERIAGFLSHATGLPAAAFPLTIDPQSAYDPGRGQHDTRKLLPALERIARERGTHVLGIADFDLYSAIFTFVFGEARLHGPAGLVSLHRLRPTLYGLPDDPELFEARVRTEVLHEAGHLLGLVHCADPECVMRFSGSAEEIDLKRDAFCHVCRDAIESPGSATGAAGGAGPETTPGSP